MQRQKEYKYLIILILLVMFSLSGCASAPIESEISSIRTPKRTDGLYHKVEKGQTLWRISKMYDIDLDELTEVNKITDVTNIEVGQLLFIPRLKKEPIVNYSNFDDFSWPVKGRVVSGFGSTYNNMLNKGINITPYADDANICASRSGKVVFFNSNFKGYGRTIIIDHGDGFLTIYSGAGDVSVKPGDSVSKGSSIGKLSNSSLHFEIRKKEVPQNPVFYLQ